MIPKTKGAEDSCPSCHQVLVCREKEYKGETSLQWQYKDKEEAHFSFDFKTKKSACKETAGGSQASTTSSVTTDTLNLDKISIPGDQIASITQATAEMTERMLVVFSGVQRVCNNAGIYHPATVGMIYNQVCENRRSE
jgi:hypothetical protein